MSATPVDEKTEARLALVREHVACENTHDLAGIMRTFGDVARYDDEPAGEHHVGTGAVQKYYEQLLQSVPNLFIDVQREHVTPECIILEVVIRGTHAGTWRGLPATNRTVAIPLCGVFTFDGNDRLSGERIYYDRATVLRQLGVFHEPETVLGKLLMVLSHPVTMARIAMRRLKRRPN